MVQSTTTVVYDIGMQKLTTQSKIKIEKAVDYVVAQQWWHDRRWQLWIENLGRDIRPISNLQYMPVIARFKGGPNKRPIYAPCYLVNILWHCTNCRVRSSVFNWSIFICEVILRHRKLHLWTKFWNGRTSIGLISNNWKRGLPNWKLKTRGVLAILATFRC
jgi:hypothetical protein